MASMRNALSNVAANSRRPNSPIPLLLIGLACIVFWLLASLLEIQTSEAFLLHGAVVTFNPNWSILRQPVDLVQGHLSADMAKAAMWGWGIELIYLVCIVGHEIAHEGVRSTNRHLAGWFTTGAVALIAFDAWTNFQYGQLASGVWGQVAFALVTAFIVPFFAISGFPLFNLPITI